jgi:ribonucleoside-diphosphate reductase alpha chain
MTDIANLLQSRYYQPGEGSWTDLIGRVVNYVYGAGNVKDKARAVEALMSKAFVPSSPVLMNAGTRYPMMCSCFVLPVEDNIQSIMQTLSQTVFIQKFGGGVGINFSKIRAEGSRIRSTNGIASGPVSFMGFWNEGMNVIRQGGKRQGAMMGILNVEHPDLELFLNAKQREGRLTNFNLSTMIPAEFWLQPESQRDAQLTRIAGHTWANGEPGVLFKDNINATPHYGALEIEATNPCGEVPLPPYGACTLGSINLARMMAYDDGGYTFDWAKFEHHIEVGIEFLDSVIDTTWWPIQEVADFETQYRPIGLGVLGLADTLAMLKIPYGTDDALQFTETLMIFVRDKARAFADKLANERGLPRNATTLSIAPTGTIAMLAGASYSIEPFFTFTGQKHVEAGEFQIDSSIVGTVAKLFNETPSRADQESIQATGTVAETGLSQEVKEVLRTANEIPWETHVAMQALVQKYVDNAVSKTINMPHSATIEDVRRAIVMAHEMGCKGLTLYRAGSRDKEVIEGVSSR